MRKRRVRNGFTLLEMLVAIFIIGLLAAMIAPGWLGYSERNRLTVGRDKIYSALRDTQVKAQSRGVGWQFSLRERDNRIEWTNHPRSVSPSSAQWEVLESSSIRIDDETTFATSSGIYYVRFDDEGNVQYRLGRITLSSRKNPRIKRCVIVSTIVGAMRKSQEQATPKDGKLCY